MSTPPSPSFHRRIGWYVGLAVAGSTLWLPAPEALSVAGWRTAGLGLCMGIWWATEALPVPVTALLPIALFPVLGITDLKSATAPYSHPILYLFVGGFMVAVAIQRWNLHRRIALAVVTTAGGSGASLVGGFMLAAALLSMWVTNTSTTMMLLPIAVSVAALVGQSTGAAAEAETEARKQFPIALLLGVAYGATIGGMATLVGTPPNALLAGFLADNYDIELGFARWMAIGLPISAVMLALAWLLLTKVLHPVPFTTSGATRAHLSQLRRDLGAMTTPERRVAMVGATLAVCWLTRPAIVKVDALSGLSDPGLAMLAGIALFLVPSGAGDGSRLLRWPDMKELPWGLVILFGGGLSLAAAVSATGLAGWLGAALTGMGLTSQTLLVIVVVALIIFLTELTSNLATTATFLPVVGAVAVEAGMAPIALAAPVALAASCAFMLPVATPPNAVVFGSGQLTIPQMVRAGFLLNLAGIVVVSLAAILFF